MLVNDYSNKVSNMGREEQLGFEVICNWNSGYPSILEVLRPIKKIKGKWVEIRKKNEKRI